MKRLTDVELETVSDALVVLRSAARGAFRIPQEVREAFNTLDDADVFEEIDTEYEARQEAHPDWNLP